MKNQLLLKIKNSSILIIFDINKIINNFLLTVGKFIPELYLKPPEFSYSACGDFTKHCKKIKKFRETGNLKHL